MRVINYIVLSPTEPSQTDVLWVKPMGGGVVFYLFDGTWKPLKLVDSKSTSITSDDTIWEGGSSGGGQLGPNTVGSEEIINGSVKLQDLNKEVTERLEHSYDDDNEALYLDGTKPQ